MAVAYNGYLQALNQALNAAEFTTGNGMELAADHFFQQFFTKLECCRESGGKVMIIGNGGSQAIASHMTTDLIKSLSIPALAFSDPSNMTCLSNDLGYAAAYAQQVALFAEREDILIAISSSGQSENIVRGVAAARARAVWTLTLTGFSSGNPVRQAGDLNYYVPAQDYGFVELSHGILCHALCDLAAARTCAQKSGQPVFSASREKVA